MIEVREQPCDGTWAVCMAQVHVHHWQMFEKCRCILNKIIKMPFKSYLSLKYMNPYGSGPEQRVSRRKEHGDVVRAAAKGTATCCMPP